MERILKEFAAVMEAAAKEEADQQAAENAAYWDYIEQEELDMVAQYQATREEEEEKEASRNS